MLSGGQTFCKSVNQGGQIIPNTYACLEARAIGRNGETTASSHIGLILVSSYIYTLLFCQIIKIIPIKFHTFVYMTSARYVHCRGCKFVIMTNLTHILESIEDKDESNQSRKDLLGIPANNRSYLKKNERIETACNEFQVGR